MYRAEARVLPTEFYHYGSFIEADEEFTLVLNNNYFKKHYIAEVDEEIMFYFLCDPVKLSDNRYNYICKLVDETLSLPYAVLRDKLIKEVRPESIERN